MKKFKNTWFITVMILVLIFGFTITSTLSYMVTKNYVFTHVIDQTLFLISDNIYSEITKELIDPINISSLMANDTFLIDWVQQGEKDVEEITAYLKRIANRYGYTSAFFVSEVSKNYYYTEGILKTISSQNDHDIWYERFKALNRSIDLDVDHDEARDEVLTVFINHRLEDSEGVFLGVTGVGLELSDVGEKFAAYQQKYDHQIFLVDEEGFIQIHSDPTIVDSQNYLERDGVAQLEQPILKPLDTIQIHDFRDQEGLKAISIRYIPEFDWYLIIEKNQETSLIAAKQSLLLNTLIGLVITFGITMLLILLMRAYNQRLEALAFEDSLTGLSNRRHFLYLMERELLTAQRNHHPVSVLMMDIDNFKSVNDLYGHLIGDDLLGLISKAIKQTVRSTDLVGRWGGEEFIALLINTGADEAVFTGQRILEAVAQLSITTENGTAVHRTISIGVYTVENLVMEDEQIIKMADQALLRAKKTGKNVVSK